MSGSDPPFSTGSSPRGPAEPAHAHLTPRVAALLHGLGLPNSPLEPVESFSNAVWLTKDHAVHYHVVGPAGRLEHEARVAKRLPAESLYPKVVAVGRDGEHDWLVTQRVRGVPLTEAWPALGNTQRRQAVRQMAAALRAVHRSRARDLVPPCLQGGAPVVSRRDLASRLRSQSDSPAVRRILTLEDPPSVMAHGDFNFNQVIWHDGRVAALLDLEMSHAEGPDWDLAPFLGFCLDPVRAVPEYLEPISSPDLYREAPRWLAEAYPEMVAVPRLRERLALYTVVLRLPELDDHPERLAQIVDESVEGARTLEQLLH